MATMTVKVPWSLWDQKVHYTEQSDGTWKTEPHQWAVYHWGDGSDGIVPEYIVGEDDFPADYSCKNVFKALKAGEISRENVEKLFKKLADDDEWDSSFEETSTGLVSVLRHKDWSKTEVMGVKATSSILILGFFIFNKIIKQYLNKNLKKLLQLISKSDMVIR